MNEIDDIREEGDAFHDECGVFGIFGKPDAAAVVTLGLHALQHRGQEAAGIVSYDGKQFHVERHVGLIGDTFTKPAVIARLQGDRAIGHTRYSTTGGEGLRNVQPLFAELADGGFAVAHNGNITNAMTVQRKLQKRGAIFSSTSDTETILHLVAMSEEPALHRQVHRRGVPARRRLLASSPCPTKKMIGGARSARHPPARARRPRRRLHPRLRNLRPRHHRRALRARHRARRGRRHHDRTASRASSPSRGRQARFCIFEYVYFARPDSIIEGRNVYEVSKHIGAELAERDARSRPTSSCRCPIPARRRRSASPRTPAFPSSSASSATTMSAAPSSSRRIRSATWA